MRASLILLLLLSALPLAFMASLNYTASYSSDGWLSVSANVQSDEGAGCAGAITGACGSTGAVVPSSVASGSTQISLVLTNTGPAERQNVEVLQELSFVPSGSALFFQPAPSLQTSTEATWQLGALAKGESKTLLISFDSSLQKEIALPQLLAKSSPPKITISAPLSSKAGDTIAVAAKSASGSPLEGISITVGFPDGTSRELVTDSEGKASLLAAKEGFYTYSAEGYELSSLPSTEVKKLQQVTAAQSASASGLPGRVVSFLSSLAPLLAAIFVTAVVTFILYGFITQKKEEPYHAPLQEQHATAPSQHSSLLMPPQVPPKEPSAPPVSPLLPVPEQAVMPILQPAQPEKEGMALDTRRLVGLRKKKLWEGEKTYQNHSYLPQPPIDSVQGHEASEGHVIALESLSSQEGESTLDEGEIEKTMRQLEEIRQKLRERKEQLQSMETTQAAYVNRLSQEQVKRKSALKQIAEKAAARKAAGGQVEKAPHRQAGKPASKTLPPSRAAKGKPAYRIPKPKASSKKKGKKR